MYSICGMILTEETHKLGETSVPVPLRPPHISDGQPPRWHTGDQQPESQYGATLSTISTSHRHTEHSESIEGSKGCVLHESQKHKYSEQRVKCRVLEVKMASPTVFEEWITGYIFKAHWQNPTPHKVTRKISSHSNYRRRRHRHHHLQSRQQKQEQLHTCTETNCMHPLSSINFVIQTLHTKTLINISQHNYFIAYEVTCFDLSNNNFQAY